MSLTKIPDEMLQSGGGGVDFSPNGRFMALAQFSAPNAIQLYRIAGAPRIYSLLEGG
jgi:hypothetical protein